MREDSQPLRKEMKASCVCGASTEQGTEMLSEPLKQNQQVESSEGFNPMPVLNSHVFGATSRVSAPVPILYTKHHLSVAIRDHPEAKSGHSEENGKWQMAGRNRMCLMIQCNNTRPHSSLIPGSLLGKLFLGW